MIRDFWKSAGIHLVSPDESGRLKVTPDYLRAYLTRPEIHPVEESCPAEHRLFEMLMEDPYHEIGEAEIQSIVDRDAAENYAILLRFRDHLVKHQTIEAAYCALFSGKTISVPPMFIDQMVHLILRNVLSRAEDPMQLRTAELFFREQAVSIGEEQLILADQEIVEMKTEAGYGGLGQLLVESGTPAREVTLDVMTEENKQLYWERSDRFDMAVDFRFTQPAPDALGRVIESWMFHLLKVETRVQAMKAIRDERWSWHIGCDQESTRILNALYDGQELSEQELMRIIALYRVEFINSGDILDTLRGKPVYLGVAMDSNSRLIFKPQNLLTNLPLQLT